MADDFGNQVSGTPIDCKAISFLPAGIKVLEAVV
jgi:hypothetical protein